MDVTEPRSEGVQAEPDRVPTRVVVGLAVVLVAASALAMIVVFGLFRSFEKKAETRDAASLAAAGAERRPETLPPAPRLQIQPVRHWRDFRDAERERLGTYGWMDRSTGAVHLPIERAIDLVLARGVGPLAPAPMAMPAPPAAKPAAEAQGDGGKP
jgi:hypothetical protein